MKKGILVETKKDYAIVMNECGIMESIEIKDDMKIGQKIFYFEEDVINLNINKSVHRPSLFKTFGTFAALFLLIFTFFQGITYETAYAVVSLDINPSIQIEVDNKKKVVKVEGVNADGKKFDFSDVKGLEINQGIEIIKTKLVEKQYLDKDGEVLVAFAFLNGENDKVYEDTIQEAIKTTFKTENVTYITGDKEDVEEAKTKGISLGRYEASLSATEAIKINIEQIPVKEITSAIKDKQNCIYWKADESSKVETPKVDKDIPIEKPVEKPIEITVPKKDITPQKPIKEIAPPQQNTNEGKENTEVKVEPEVVPETKPEPIIPPVEKPKPDENNNIGSNNSNGENSGSDNQVKPNPPKVDETPVSKPKS
ncbi:anti-sigma-I factor RsgI family protein [Clostridium uliginosum]|uniref:Anti-sigma factor N-terminus n=1 Tax=Clostridium uliginosum TaxID=119641 RepID=A0A1I1N6A2_9CLOT|nr:anti-sigma factor domain-containing protein [Clostridium uliginosum]SFC90333.1 Anti-sigma factor N-terminus [Clostridium uliginosum]